jgi:hypothetical protein
MTDWYGIKCGECNEWDASNQCRRCGKPNCDDPACAKPDPNGSGETICATCYNDIVDQWGDEDRT